jgi:hypothetical protein
LKTGEVLKIGKAPIDWTVEGGASWVPTDPSGKLDFLIGLKTGASRLKTLACGTHSLAAGSLADYESPGSEGNALVLIKTLGKGDGTKVGAFKSSIIFTYCSFLDLFFPLLFLDLALGCSPC